MGDAAWDATFRTIDELAALVGHYCWVERRIFELAGRWASEIGEPEVRVFFSEAAARHAAFASQWGLRLPVRAGVDVAALVVPPSGAIPTALDALDSQPDLARRLAGVVRVLLPYLLVCYDHHASHALPVSEAPVLATLGLIRYSGRAEIDRGRGVAQRALLASDQADSGAEFCADLERSFGDGLGISPGVRPS